MARIVTMEEIIEGPLQKPTTVILGLTWDPIASIMVWSPGSSPQWWKGVSQQPFYCAKLYDYCLELSHYYRCFLHFVGINVSLLIFDKSE